MNLASALQLGLRLVWPMDSTQNTGWGPAWTSKTQPKHGPVGSTNKKFLLRRPKDWLIGWPIALEPHLRCAACLPAPKALESVSLLQLEKRTGTLFWMEVNIVNNKKNIQQIKISNKWQKSSKTTKITYSKISMVYVLISCLDFFFPEVHRKSSSSGNPREPSEYPTCFKSFKLMVPRLAELSY